MAAEYEQKKSILDYFFAQKLSPLPHLHKELELIYVQKGACCAIANGKEYTLSDGDIFLTFPYQVHYYLDAVPGEYFVHAFPASALTIIEKTINSHELLNNLFRLDSDSAEAEYFHKIRNASGPYVVAERLAYLILIMSKLLPRCDIRPITHSSSATVQNILEYCSTHYTENLSLDTLSEQLHLSKYYISHSINRHINMRLSTFINSMRVEAACKMLSTTNKRITEIAQAVGFDTIRSFNRSFINTVGITPKEFRQRNTQEPNN